MRQIKKLLEESFDFQMDRLRVYPEVIGGIGATHREQSGLEHKVESLSDLLAIYEGGESVLITISGENELDKSRRVTFTLDVLENTASMRISAKDTAFISVVKDSFERIFPFTPYHKLDYLLLQRGFNYSSERSEPIPDYRKYSSRAARIKVRERMVATAYGRFFERYCETVAYYELRWSTLFNVKLKGEGLGGDYDVLALSEPIGDMVYIEAKTGNVGTDDFIHYARRRQVLRPTFSIIILDHSPDVLAAKLPLLGSALQEIYELEETPTAMPIPTLKGGQAFNLLGNIFFICGDDVVRSIQHCVRYYDGTARSAIH